MHGLVGLKFICGADQDYYSSSTHPTHVIIFLQTPTTVWDQEYSKEKGGKKKTVVVPTWKSLITAAKFDS